jgi:hypothetical protein
LSRLQARRCALQAQAGPRLDFDQETLRRETEAMVAEWRALLERDPETVRPFLEAILGGQRIRVVPEGAGSYRLEGMIDLAALETRTPASTGAEAGGSVVAGGRFVRVPTRLRGRRFPLPWAA